MQAPMLVPCVTFACCVVDEKIIYGVASPTYHNQLLKKNVRGCLGSTKTKATRDQRCDRWVEHQLYSTK